LYFSKKGVKVSYLTGFAFVDDKLPT